MSEIDRRQFLSFTGVLAIIGAVPASMITAIDQATPRIEDAEYLEIEIDEDIFHRSLSIGAPYPIRGNWQVNVNMNEEIAWQAVTAIDNRGYCWQTPDEGKTWRLVRA